MDIINTIRHNGNCFYWQGPREVDFVAKKGRSLQFFEVKYRKKVSAADFKWFEKTRPKGAPLTVVTKQDLGKHERIRLIPASIFLLQLCTFCTNVPYYVLFQRILTPALAESIILFTKTKTLYFEKYYKGMVGGRQIFEMIVFKLIGSLPTVASSFLQHQLPVYFRNA